MNLSRSEAKVQVDETAGLRDVARPRASLRDVARVAGVSESLVYKVAAGQRRPNAAIRRAVEELFGVPAWSVFGNDVARRWGSK